MKFRLASGIAVAACLLGLLAPFAAACPNCVNSIPADTSTGSPGTSGSMAGGIGGSMAAGYYYSILFSVPGIFVFVVCRHARAATQMPET